MADLVPRETLPPTEAADSDSNWTETKLGKLAAGVVLTVEGLPFTNEAARFAVLGLAIKYGDPAMAAVAYGATTMAIEGSGAVVAADLIDSDSGSKAVAGMQKVLSKAGVDNLRTNLPTEAAVAMVVGAPAATFLKHQQESTRTRDQNRRYGLKASAGISAMSAVQGYLVAEGIHSPSPLTIALGSLAVGSVLGGYKWASRRIKRNHQENTNVLLELDADTAAAAGNEVVDDEATIRRSVRQYAALVYDPESPQHLGLNSVDVEAALRNPKTIKAKYETPEGDVYIPFLVPIDTLYWFNKDYLSKQYATDELYYFAHASDSFTENDPRGQALKVLTDRGGVVIFDTTNQPERGVKGDMRPLVNQEHSYVIDQLGSEKQVSFLNQYEGVVTFGDTAEPPVFSERLSAYRQYVTATESGMLKQDPNNGTAFVDVLEGEEAEQVWGFYNAPFLRIGEKNPIGAGYDREGFMELLQDPSVLKCVNREDGRITTLSLYVTDLKHCPWLNEEYYATKYPEAYATGNIFISLGIVADESSKAKTSSRSLSMINLCMKTMALRGTPIVLAFECNEVSSKYIPRIVQLSINHSSASSRVDGLNPPKSQLNFFALRQEKA